MAKSMRLASVSVAATADSPFMQLRVPWSSYIELYGTLVSTNRSIFLMHGVVSKCTILHVQTTHLPIAHDTLIMVTNSCMLMKCMHLLSVEILYRRCILAIFFPRVSVLLSVCMSVCPPQAGIVSKRLQQLG